MEDSNVSAAASACRASPQADSQTNVVVGAITRVRPEDLPFFKNLGKRLGVAGSTYTMAAFDQYPLPVIDIRESNAYIKHDPVTPAEYKRWYKDTYVPIIIDCGSSEVRAGYATDPNPRIIIPNAAVLRAPRDGVTTYHVGRFTVDTITAGRGAMERNVVQSVHLLEVLLDYIFEGLGLAESHSVAHPIIFTECPANIAESRILVNELLFGCYQIPAICYAIDMLLSWHYNTNVIGLSNLCYVDEHRMRGERRRPDTRPTKEKGPVENGLIISMSHEHIHILPIINKTPLLLKAQRMALGSLTIQNYLQQIFLLQRPDLRGLLSSQRMSQILSELGVVAPYGLRPEFLAAAPFVLSKPLPIEIRDIMLDKACRALSTRIAIGRQRLRQLLTGKSIFHLASSSDAERQREYISSFTKAMGLAAKVPHVAQHDQDEFLIRCGASPAHAQALVEVMSDSTANYACGCGSWCDGDISVSAQDVVCPSCAIPDSAFVCGPVAVTLGPQTNIASSTQTQQLAQQQQQAPQLQKYLLQIFNSSSGRSISLNSIDFSSLPVAYRDVHLYPYITTPSCCPHDAFMRLEAASTLKVMYDGVVDRFVKRQELTARLRRDLYRRMYERMKAKLAYYEHVMQMHASATTMEAMQRVKEIVEAEGYSSIEAYTTAMADVRRRLKERESADSFDEEGLGDPLGNELAEEPLQLTTDSAAADKATATNPTTGSPGAAASSATAIAPPTQGSTRGRRRQQLQQQAQEPQQTQQHQQPQQPQQQSTAPSVPTSEELSASQQHAVHTLKQKLQELEAHYNRLLDLDPSGSSTEFESIQEQIAAVKTRLKQLMQQLDKGVQHESLLESSSMFSAALPALDPKVERALARRDRFPASVGLLAFNTSLQPGLISEHEMDQLWVESDEARKLLTTYFQEAIAEMREKDTPNDKWITRYLEELTSATLRARTKLREKRLDLWLERTRILEMIFQPTMYGMKIQGLTECISQVLNSLPEDALSPGQTKEQLMREIAGNVLLTGGLSQVAFMATRIYSEISTLLPAAPTTDNTLEMAEHSMDDMKVDTPQKRCRPDVHSDVRVHVAANPILDPWFGARAFVWEHVTVAAEVYHHRRSSEEPWDVVPSIEQVKAWTAQSAHSVEESIFGDFVSKASMTRQEWMDHPPAWFKPHQFSNIGVEEMIKLAASSTQ